MEQELSSPETSRPGPTARLNDLLCEVLDYLMKNAQHADFFRAAVSCVIVDDYRDFVPADKEMHLGRMLERARQEQYHSLTEFRADLELMHQNAAAYNGRNGGKHAYKPVIHWAADLIATAEEQLLARMCAISNVEAELQAKPHQSDIVEKDTEAIATAAALTNSPCSKPAEAALERPACEGPSSAPLQVEAQQQQQPPPPPPQQQQQPQPQEQPQQQQNAEEPRKRRAAGASGSPLADGGNGNGSAGQQSSSPSSGSGDASHSGLEALLAACELAAEQDSAEAAPRSCAPAPVADGATAGNPPPERRSYPGCAASPSGRGSGVEQQRPSTEQLALVAMTGGAGQQPVAPHEEHAGSSEDGGGGRNCNGGAEPGGAASTVQPGAGGGGSGSGGGHGGTAASSSYLTSNAFKNRRHKSKVYIKPNKVVYLPTTFVEEEFDVLALPLDCELRVEADGVLTDEVFRVTIKAVPRQGLSTMYCMTNVMRFQQQYLNWQIYNWTRIDNDHIKIHLQSPAPGQGPPPRTDTLDRAASLPDVGRGGPGRMSEDGAAMHLRAGGSLKRKSDTGRHNVTKVERRVVVEPIRGDWPLDLRLSTTGYLHRPSPIPESPPSSPQRHIAALPAAASYPLSHSSRFPVAAHSLPPRAPLQAAAQHMQLYHALQQQQQQQQALALQFPALQARGGAAQHSHAVVLKHELQNGGSDGLGPAEVLGSFGFPHPSSQQTGRMSGCGTAGTGGVAGGGSGSGSARSSSTQLEQHIQELVNATGVHPGKDLATLITLASLQQQQQQQQQSAQQRQQQQQQGACDSDGEAAPLDLAIVPAGGDGATALAVDHPQQASSHTLHHPVVRGINCLDLQLANTIGRRDAGSSEVDGGEYAGEYEMGGGNGNGRVHALVPVVPHREVQQLQRRTSLMEGVGAGGGGGAGRLAPLRLIQQSPKDMEEGGDADIADDQHQQDLMRRSLGSKGSSGHALAQYAGAGLGLGRVAFDLGGGGGAAVAVSGAGRGGRRSNGTGGAGAAGMAAAEGGSTYTTLDLSAAGLPVTACSAAELASLLSPSKRFKYSVPPGQLQAAADASGPVALNGMDLGLLEAAAAAMRAGQLVPSVDAATLAVLRGAAAGSFATATIGGRPALVQMGPELMGQLM